MATKQKKGSPKAGAVPPPVTKSSSLKHKFNGETIRVISDEFPVRKGSRRAEIFALFQDGMNLSDFLIAARKIRGGATDVQIALDKKYIELA
tara:strand:+ start:9986 stop:10261 length:276 start_codon:yes stop_codon:yes gene_type:complete